jgi:hypothetical protein
MSPSSDAQKRDLESDISNAIHKALTSGVDPIDVLDVLRGHVAELVATIKAEKRTPAKRPPR